MERAVHNETSCGGHAVELVRSCGVGAAHAAVALATALAASRSVSPSAELSTQCSKHLLGRGSDAIRSAVRMGR